VAPPTITLKKPPKGRDDEEEPGTSEKPTGKSDEFTDKIVSVCC